MHLTMYRRVVVVCVVLFVSCSLVTVAGGRSILLTTYSGDCLRGAGDTRTYPTERCVPAVGTLASTFASLIASVDFATSMYNVRLFKDAACHTESPAALVGRGNACQYNSYVTPPGLYFKIDAEIESTCTMMLFPDSRCDLAPLNTYGFVPSANATDCQPTVDPKGRDHAEQWFIDLTAQSWVHTLFRDAACQSQTDKEGGILDECVTVGNQGRFATCNGTQAIQAAVAPRKQPKVTLVEV